LNSIYSRFARLRISCALVLLPAISSGLLAATNEEIYKAKIAPVLAEKCASCHSGTTPAGNLVVAGFSLLLAGGKRGPALIPGAASNSLMIQYLRGQQSPRMPLDGELPAATIDALERAIDEMAPLTTKADDAHAKWLFAKPQRPPVPEVRNLAAVANPIDAFIVAKLEAKGMSLAPQVSKRSLLRRVYFDLIGLPPSAHEASTFLADNSPDAYEKLIDRLLADHRYGERWGRHWLDLTRFAESDGFAIDRERPSAWRYRDYVIRSFNSDKPYDLFVKEQIAGDELNDKRFAAGDRSDRLVALGFLRMATWEADANFKTQLRQDFLNEITGTTASVFLGVTVGCARCHDHKYDPIPQKDFYRLLAFFGATRIDERPAPFTKAEDPDKQMKSLLRRYEDEAEGASEALKRADERFKELYIARKGLKPDDKSAGKYAGALKDNRDATFSEAERTEYSEIRNRSLRLTELAPRVRALAYSVSDVIPPHVSEIAHTYVLLGGELSAKGEAVEPGFPSSVTGNSDPAVIPFAGGSSGRRTALAEWIASSDNPLAARVMVNRIWQHHFGEGIVRTASDFGRNGDRPSHPELLDWLATEFVEKKWSIKAMHKLMLLSNTYRQSTANPASAQYEKQDPENRLFWRMNWLRLESETIRDAMLSVAGRLRQSKGGPGAFLDVAPDVAEGFEFFKWFPSPSDEQNVRTIYTFQRRSVVMPMMEVFDGANMAESCARRNTTTVPPQAFNLLNSEFSHRMAKAFAARVLDAAGADKDRQLNLAFRLALARPPTEAELSKAREVSLDNLALVLLNLNEFIYLE
jgi:hypothetical protein